MQQTTSTVSPPVEKAPKATGRYRGLDVLRGIAILGTLGTNIFVFVSAGRMPAPFGWLDAVAGQFTNGKFLALLTLMFGIGLAIQADAAARRSQRWPLVYIWRGLLLLLDGFLHYLLVVSFDVLMGYAITALIVSYLLLTTKRFQWLVATAAGLVHIAFVALPVLGVGLPFLGSYGYVEGGTNRTMNVPEAMRGGDVRMLEGTGIEGYWPGVMERWATFLQGREEVIFILPMCICLFLIGAALYRRGVLDERGARIRWWLIGVGAAAFAYDMISAMNPSIGLPGNAGRYLVPIPVALGIAAAVSQFYQGRLPGKVGRVFELIGRCALSCYVGQNVASVLLFDDWALNIDKLIPNEWALGKVLICYLLVTAIMLVMAWTSLKFLGKGPLEWLWQKSYDGLMKLTPSWSEPKREAKLKATASVSA